MSKQQRYEGVSGAMKRKSSDEMTHSAVRLPRDLLERLKRAGGERGMGEEIRRRLEASFEAEKTPSNPKTRELLEAISSFAEETNAYYGSWSEDAFAFRVLKACVDMLLTSLEPKGDAVPKPTRLGEMLFDPDHSVDEISRVFVSGWKRDQAKRNRPRGL